MADNANQGPEQLTPKQLVGYCCIVVAGVLLYLITEYFLTQPLIAISMTFVLFLLCLVIYWAL